MKRFLTLYLLVALLSVSCKKDSPSPPAKTNEDLLVDIIWKTEQITSAQENAFIYYKRGGSNNTFNYDNYDLKFNKDGTGKYTTGDIIYDITWEFTNVGDSELTYIIHNYANGSPENGINLEVRLENIYLNETTFKYAELYTNNNGKSVISSVIRIK